MDKVALVTTSDRIARQFLSVSRSCRPRAKRPHDFGLAIWGYLTIARESGQDLLMSQILTPRLELLRRAAAPLAEHGEGVLEAVRIEAWQSNGFKRVLEERPDCICVAPMPACQSCRPELAIMAMFDEGCRKQRVVQPPEPISCQKFDPFDDNPLSVASDREESRRLRLLFLVFTSRGS
jgi:hypothetical protein